MGRRHDCDATDTPPQTGRFPSLLGPSGSACLARLYGWAQRQPDRGHHPPDGELDASPPTHHARNHADSVGNRLERDHPAPPHGRPVRVFLRDAPFLDLCHPRPLLRARRHHRGRDRAEVRDRGLRRLRVIDPAGRHLDAGDDAASRWETLALVAPAHLRHSDCRRCPLLLAGQARVRRTAYLRCDSDGFTRHPPGISELPTTWVAVYGSATLRLESRVVAHARAASFGTRKRGSVVMGAAYVTGSVPPRHPDTADAIYSTTASSDELP